MKPSDYQTIEPYDSVLQEKKSEIVALNIMKILARTQNIFRSITWDEYVIERKKDGNFTNSEEEYFNLVSQYFKTEKTARSFCPNWKIKENIQLTKEQIGEIELCKNSITYFVKNYIKIKNKNGEAKSFEPNENQINLLLETFSGKRTIALDLESNSKFPLLLEISCLYSALFGEYQNIGIIDQNIGFVKESIRKIKFMYNELPDWFKKTFRFSDNKKTSINFENYNQISGGLLDSGFCCGRTFNLLIINNAGIISDKSIDELVLSYLPVHYSNKKSVIIFCSTGNKMSRKMRQIYKNADCLIFD